jgi:hypothetical protein
MTTLEIVMKKTHFYESLPPHPLSRVFLRLHRSSNASEHPSFGGRSGLSPLL